MKAFSEGKIGNLTVKNRIAMAPMISNLGTPAGEVTDQHIRYLVERARGGAGLIITEYTYVDRINSRGSPNELGAYGTELAPKLRRLTEKVKEQGTGIFMQLVHAGGKALDQINSRGNFAPSQVDYLGKTPQEMSLDDIESVKDSFAMAAKLAEDTGFDGVEIHGAHGYLVQEFISPALNRRTDSYGGSLENRVRFAQEIVDSVRKATHFQVGIRLSLLEFDRDGYGPDYGFSVASHLRNVDYVHFSAGRNAPPGSSGSFYLPHTPIIDMIPGRLSVPIMAVGSVMNADDIERSLSKVDFVSMGRSLLADPYLPRKIQLNSGIPRPCIRCNQACRKLSLGEVRCTVNPDTGLEGFEREIRRYHGELDIAGAGIKGLEAALYAAKSGLTVTVHELEDNIGGQIRSIFEDHHRNEFSGLIAYYVDSLKRLGVQVITGEKFSGKGAYCLPDKVYPAITEKETISMDTNIYQYLDRALSLAEKHEVILSERSVASLDRARGMEYRKIAEKAGIAIRNLEKYDVVLFEKEQYDIRSAMVSGRREVREYLAEMEMDYL
ncbi:MAG: oxidoreductase [Thermoplasmataceae archaeon]